MFDPFLESATVIQIHAVNGVIALFTGPFALYSRKYGLFHKIIGYVWFTAMLTVAVTAFFIHSFGVIGPFSPLHLFAVSTILTIAFALWQIRKGNVAAHRDSLRSLYWYGLCLASLVNFLPQRMVNRSFFPDSPNLGFVVIGLGSLVVLGSILRSRQQRFAALHS